MTKIPVEMLLPRQPLNREVLWEDVPSLLKRGRENYICSCPRVRGGRWRGAVLLPLFPGYHNGRFCPILTWTLDLNTFMFQSSVWKPSRLLFRPFTNSALEFWSWWDLVSHGVPLQLPAPSYILIIDASNYKRGQSVVLCQQGLLVEISCRAEDCVLLPLKKFQMWLCGRLGRVQTDSTAVVQSLKRIGGTRPRSLDWLVHKFI